MCGFWVVLQSVSSSEAHVHCATAERGLHRVRYEPLVQDALLDHHLRGVERRVYVSARHDPVERLVVRRVLMELGSALVHRLVRLHDHRQRLVVHLDQLQRVLCGVPAVRHHDRDGVSLVSDHVVRDRRMVDRLEVRVRYQPCAGDGVELGVDVRAGEHGDYPVHRGRGRHVDRLDPGVCVRAAQDGRVRHAGQRDVVRVACGARDQPRVLTAAYPRAEYPGRHWLPSCRARGLCDGAHDVLIPGAPAVVAFDSGPYLLFGGAGVVLQELRRRHYHAGRAEAALEPVLGPEGLLQRMEVAGPSQSLDRRDRAAVGLRRQHRAGLDRRAVDLHGAAAALARIAPDLGARQPRDFSDKVHQQHAGTDVALVHATVNRDIRLDLHEITSLHPDTIGTRNPNAVIGGRPKLLTDPQHRTLL